MAGQHARHSPKQLDLPLAARRERSLRHSSRVWGHLLRREQLREPDVLVHVNVETLYGVLAGSAVGTAMVEEG